MAWTRAGKGPRSLKAMPSTRTPPWVSLRRVCLCPIKRCPGDHEGAFKNRRRKTLAPNAHREFPREAQRQLVGSEFAIGFNCLAQGGRRQPLPGDALELRDEARQLGLPGVSSPQRKRVRQNG